MRAARQAFDLSEQRLREGTVDLITVLNTQQTLFQAQDTLAQVRFARLHAVVSSVPGARRRLAAARAESSRLDADRYDRGRARNGALMAEVTRQMATSLCVAIAVGCRRSSCVVIAASSAQRQRAGQRARQADASAAPAAISRCRRSPRRRAPPTCRSISMASAPPRALNTVTVQLAGRRQADQAQFQGRPGRRARLRTGADRSDDLSGAIRSGGRQEGAGRGDCSPTPASTSSAMCGSPPPMPVATAAGRHAKGAGRAIRSAGEGRSGRDRQYQRAYLDYTKIVAPIAGRTGIRLVDVGNIVQGSRRHRPRCHHAAAADLRLSSRCRSSSWRRSTRPSRKVR